MSKPIVAADLLGCWNLEGWSLVYEDGRPDEHPLGRDALGVIMYTPDGRVSAVLSRAGRVATAPASPAEMAAAYEQSFAYAGSFVVTDGVVEHAIDIANNPALIGMTAKRSIALDGDRLTLTGADFAAGARRTQKIAWRRVTG